MGEDVVIKKRFVKIRKSGSNNPEDDIAIRRRFVEGKRKPLPEDYVGVRRTRVMPPREKGDVVVRGYSTAISDEDREFRLSRWLGLKEEVKAPEFVQRREIPLEAQKPVFVNPERKSLVVKKFEESAREVKPKWREEEVCEDISEPLSFNKKILIALCIAVFLGIAIYLTFYYNPVCENFECFQKSMSNCERAAYVNDGAGATWRYDVQKKIGGLCSVEVTLLQAKEGGLGLSSLEKHSMICEYALGVATYPEKDLDKCHGILKEELQKIVIEKLHSYVIENLGVIDVKLNG